MVRYSGAIMQMEYIHRIVVAGKFVYELPRDSI